MGNVIVFTSDESKSAIKRMLIHAGHHVSVSTDMDDCIQAVYCWDCVGLFIDACDQHDQQAKCLAYCVRIKRINPQFPVVLIIHEGDISFAVKAAQTGIKYIFEKPLKKTTFSKILDNILLRENAKYKPLAERLTGKEKRIVKYILKGHTNKEISEQLDKSIRTIEEHRANIMKKLDVVNTVDLLNCSLQAGIVDSEDISTP